MQNASLEEWLQTRGVLAQLPWSTGKDDREVKKSKYDFKKGMKFIISNFMSHPTSLSQI